MPFASWSALGGVDAFWGVNFDLEKKLHRIYLWYPALFRW